MHLGLSLVLAASGPVNPLFEESWTRVKEENALGWFTEDPSTRPPFIVRVCGDLCRNQ
jgi:hypothetical protein